MDDDGMRRHLDASIPAPDGTQIEAALAVTRRLGESRLGRRRRLRWVGPPVVALATAAVIVAVMSLSRPASPPHRPVVPALGTGAWFRHVSGQVDSASGPVSLSAVWVVRLSTTSSGTFDIQPVDRFAPGSLRYDAASRLWTVDVLTTLCGRTTASYRVVRNGDSLFFTVAKDDCAARREVLDGAVFAKLTDPSQVIG